MQWLHAASEKRTSGPFYFGESTIKNENQHSKKMYAPNINFNNIS